MLKELEEEEKASIVRLADASIASPFTSKLSTILCGKKLLKTFEIINRYWLCCFVVFRKGMNP